MPSSYLEQIRTHRDEFYALQRKARAKADESSDFLDEAEVLYLDLVYLISEAEKEEGLEPSEAQELKTILEEVKASRYTVIQDIVASFSSSSNSS